MAWCEQRAARHAGATGQAATGLAGENFEPCTACGGAVRTDAGADRCARCGGLGSVEKRPPPGPEGFWAEVVRARALIARHGVAGFLQWEGFRGDAPLSPRLALGLEMLEGEVEEQRAWREDVR